MHDSIKPLERNVKTSLYKPQINSDEHTERFVCHFIISGQGSLDQRVKKVHILLCAKKQKQNRTNFLA